MSPGSINSGVLRGVQNEQQKTLQSPGNPGVFEALYQEAELETKAKYIFFIVPQDRGDDKEVMAAVNPPCCASTGPSWLVTLR